MNNLNIDIHKVREFAEDKLNKRINAINDPTIKQEKKRLYVLNMYNSSNVNSDFIDFPNNTKQIFDLSKLRDYTEIKIKEQMKNIKNKKLSEKQKRLKVLEKDEMNTSISSNDKEPPVDDIIVPIPNPDVILEKPLKRDLNIELLEANISSSQNISTDYSSILDEDRIKYYIDQNLYDVYDTKIDKGNFKYLTQIKLEKNKDCFLYKNDLITYYFIKSYQFGKFSINNDILTDNQYHKAFGLFFCGNKIKLENNETKKCCANEMMCKECMEKNKKRYNIKNKYLININGRVAKKYKEKIHCFGHFLKENQIYDCIDKFSCEACKLLDKFEKYYFPS